MPLTLDAAIAYAERGFAVIPLYSCTVDAAGGVHCQCGNPNCTSPGKHPRNGNGLSGATTNLPTIRSWWKAWPDSNIGIATGEKSGMDVIDIDPRHQGDDTLYTLEEEYGNLPPTWRNITGSGGSHYFFKHRAGQRSKNDVWHGIDVKGDGGYVVAPPSIHASGRTYACDAEYSWEADSPLLDLPPEWAEALDAAFRGGSAAPNTVRDDFPASVEQGARNDTLYRIGCQYRARGMADAVLKAVLEAENRQRCRPPLADREVDQIWKSVCKLPPGHSKEWDEAHQKDPQEAAAQARAEADAANEKARQLEAKANKAAETENTDAAARMLQGIKSLQELEAMDIPPIEWIWDQRIAPNGFTLLAGSPKMGKSWLALELALAVAEGRPYLGRDTRQADVLYMALEDGDQRIQSRVTRVLGRRNIPENPWPRRFNYVTTAPNQGEGLEQGIEQYVKDHPFCKLVIIDILALIRPPMRGKSAKNAYDLDKDMLAPIADLCKRLGICILLVHHLNKGSGEGDEMYRISGSTAIQGLANTIFILGGKRERGQGGKVTEQTLNKWSKDSDGEEIPLLFDHGKWEVDTGAQEKQGMTQLDRIIHIIGAWFRQEILRRGCAWRGTSQLLITELKAWARRYAPSFIPDVPNNSIALGRIIAANEKSIIRALDDIHIYYNRIKISGKTTEIRLVSLLDEYPPAEEWAQRALARAGTEDIEDDIPVQEGGLPYFESEDTDEDDEAPF